MKLWDSTIDMDLSINAKNDLDLLEAIAMCNVLV